MFEGRVILAPMVRISTLPMRLLAAEYGAEIVFGPEIIDKALINAERIVNTRLGSIDYVKQGKTIFRTVPELERQRLIFQLGTADSDLALKAVKVIAQDVAGVDINCGCPKYFSVHAGMGSALLKNVPLLTSILRNLVAHSGLPISAKIRMLPDFQECVDLMKAIESAGIHAITVHCRTPTQQDSSIFPACTQKLANLIRTVQPKIPIILNGDVLTALEGLELAKSLGASGCMIARSAMWNAGCFSPCARDGSINDLMSVLKRLVELHARWGSSLGPLKYAVQHSLNGEQSRRQQQNKLTKAHNFTVDGETYLGKPTADSILNINHILQTVVRAKTIEQICQALNMATPEILCSEGFSDGEVDASTDSLRSIKVKE